MKILEIQTIRNWEDIDKYCDNEDVYVLLDNGEKYYASFFTMKEIETIIEHYKSSGENLNGSYFWASDMFIINELTKPSVEKVINDLIVTDSFEVIFTKM